MPGSGRCRQELWSSFPEIPVTNSSRSPTVQAPTSADGCKLWSKSGACTRRELMNSQEKHVGRVRCRSCRRSSARRGALKLPVYVLDVREQLVKERVRELRSPRIDGRIAEPSCKRPSYVLE